VPVQGSAMARGAKIARTFGRASKPCKLQGLAHYLRNSARLRETLRRRDTLLSDQESALAMGMIDYVYQPFPTGAQSTGSEVV